MKKIFLFLLIIVSINANAQDSTHTLSKFEKFISESGRLIKVTEVSLDKIGTIKINSQVATDLQTNVSSQAIILYQEMGSLFGKVPVGSIYIDEDELPGFISALKYIEKQVDNKPEITDTRLIYSTSNGVVLTANYSTSAYAKGWTVMVNQVYEYSRLTLPNSTIQLKNKDLERLTTALESAGTKGS